ncbi:MAG: hypothetical protein DWQ08_04690 [Proteobacteria bacterium]|nr:MAG: hypothetical protein DWQ08_04690 [Pseudomonadota bacterium]
MHRNVESGLIAVVVASVLILGGCASTRIVNAWHEDRYEGPGLANFLVIGLSSKPNRRRYFETAFADRLRAWGLSAEPSFRLIPDDDITDEKAVIEAAIAKTSADAILTTRLVDIAREESYVPPGYEFAPVGFYDYYYPTHHMLFRPGYVVTNTTVFLETNVYSAATKELLWTGTTRSFNPSSADRVVDELAGLVTGELAEFGFISAR